MAVCARRDCHRKLMGSCATRAAAAAGTVADDRPPEGQEDTNQLLQQLPLLDQPNDGAVDHLC